MNSPLLYPVTTLLSVAAGIPRKVSAYRKQLLQRQYPDCTATTDAVLVISCDELLCRKKHRTRQMWFFSGGIALFTTIFAPMVGLLLLLMVGIAAVWHGALTHHGAWLLTGCVLSSVTTALLMTVSLHLISNDLSGAFFLITVATGLVGITALSRSYTCTTQWWALAPASMLAIAGIVTLL
ncbi:MAG: hypothetical protein HC911_01960 [Chloroflexaceae bacterium]|nr:hypothetical protein [Chloroflexaceae bacterium]